MSLTSTCSITLLRIGSRRALTLAAVSRGFGCGPCRTTWTGAERDCPGCGLPASHDTAHPSPALRGFLNSERRDRSRGHGLRREECAS